MTGFAKQRPTKLNLKLERPRCIGIFVGLKQHCPGVVCKPLMRRRPNIVQTVPNNVSACCLRIVGSLLRHVF